MEEEALHKLVAALETRERHILNLLWYRPEGMTTEEIARATGESPTWVTECFLNLQRVAGRYGFNASSADTTIFDWRLEGGTLLYIAGPPIQKLKKLDRSSV